jgi:hypothetical protein
MNVRITFWVSECHWSWKPAGWWAWPCHYHVNVPAGWQAVRLVTSRFCITCHLRWHGSVCSRGLISNPRTSFLIRNNERRWATQGLLVPFPVISEPIFWERGWRYIFYSQFNALGPFLSVAGSWITASTPLKLEWANAVSILLTSSIWTIYRYLLIILITINCYWVLE